MSGKSQVHGHHVNPVQTDQTAPSVLVTVSSSEDPNSYRGSISSASAVGPLMSDGLYELDWAGS
jgi:hypothetical protein